jgi:hypothetical protein
MQRLANRLIEYEHIPYFNLLPTLCCLNIRSISAKIDDIKCDEFLQSVDVLCICETLLTHSQQTPNVIDDSTVIRHDRASGSRGGGVMIICKKNIPYTPININLSNNGIECINGMILLHGFPLILSLIYRPPQIPMRNLLYTLNTIFNNVDDNEPMIVLGDFNENFVFNNMSQSASFLLQFMGNHNFQQVVKNPTTDNATLIDLVFTRNVNPYVVGCYDIYYSDHDAVYCTLKFQ